MTSTTPPMLTSSGIERPVVFVHDSDSDSDSDLGNCDDREAAAIETFGSASGSIDMMAKTDTEFKPPPGLNRNLPGRKQPLRSCAVLRPGFLAEPTDYDIAEQTNADNQAAIARSAEPARTLIEFEDVIDLDCECESSFCCPITRAKMKDPVMAADGHSYERSAIQRWFRSKNTSPMTGAPLLNTCVIPNHALRKAIEEVRN